MAQTTQNQNPQAGGVNPEQISQIKKKIVEDIKTKLATGEMLVAIVNSVDIGTHELEREDLKKALVRDVAGLLYNLGKVTEDSLHEGNIKDFIADAVNLGYTLNDMKIDYKIYRSSMGAYATIYLTLENGHTSETIEYVDSKVSTFYLSKQEYQRYTSLVNVVEGFLNNVKKLAEELAKEKKGEEEGEEEEEEGEEDE